MISLDRVDDLQEDHRKKEHGGEKTIKIFGDYFETYLHSIYIYAKQKIDNLNSQVDVTP